MTLRTRLTEKLNITHPVLLAPMGSISGGRLAGAVSEAGGLGLIGGGLPLGRQYYPTRNFLRCPDLGTLPPSAACATGVRQRSSAMTKKFKVGDHVSWNSEAGRVSGTIVKVHAKNVNYKGYVHHASRDDPQYEIKSDRTDHIALHKGGALRHLRR